MYRSSWALLLLLVLLGGVGRAYELAELVAGSMEAEAADYYTVDARGVLVGKWVGRAEQEDLGVQNC